MPEAYLLLRDRVDAHAASITSRNSEQISCRAGCNDCCRGGLTLVAVEAVVLGAELGLEPASVHGLLNRPPLAESGPCALLDRRGRCSGYSERPIVCRTEGLPLAYPTPTGTVICEQNFQGAAPERGSAFDMTNLETALFAVNLDYCRRCELDPLGRVAIDRITAAVKEHAESNG